MGAEKSLELINQMKGQMFGQLLIILHSVATHVIKHPDDQIINYCLPSTICHHVNVAFDPVKFPDFLRQISRRAKSLENAFYSILLGDSMLDGQWNFFLCYDNIFMNT